MRKFKDNITVLMCVHSPTEMHDRLFGMALNSLTHQAFKDFKVLIVLDSCERPLTHQIVDSFKDKLNIKTLEHKKSGPSDAKNFGVDHIKTDWVAFLDADDMYMSDKLQKQVEFMEKRIDIDILGTAYWFVKHKTEMVDGQLMVFPGGLEKSYFDDNQYTTHEEISARIFDENVMCHGSVLIPKKVLKEIPYDANCTGFEDWQMWKESIKAGYKIANIPERLYIYSIGTSVLR